MHECAYHIQAKDGFQFLCVNGWFSKILSHIVLSKHWAKGLLTRMGFVRRRSTTTAKVNVPNFNEVRWQFLVNIKTVSEMEEIPFSLIINWDQTAVNYILLSSWTMEKRGTKRVEIVALDEKRQITAVFAGTLTGFFTTSGYLSGYYSAMSSKCRISKRMACNLHGQSLV